MLMKTKKRYGVRWNASWKNIFFLKNARLLFSASEKILNNFKSKIFPKKNLELEPESDLDLTKKFKLTDFWKKIICSESDINTEIFSEYFNYQNPSFLL